MNKYMEKVLKRKMTLVETFLKEFCKVNGIAENELKDRLRIASYPTENSVLVVNADDVRDIKFGVKTSLKTENGKFFPSFEVCGEFLERKDEYPETAKLLENGGDTGNTATAPEK